MIRAHGKELPRHPPRSHRPRPQSHAHADPVSRACPSRSLVSIQSPIENHKSSHKGIPPILPNMKILYRYKMVISTIHGYGAKVIYTKILCTIITTRLLRVPDYHDLR